MCLCVCVCVCYSCVVVQGGHYTTVLVSGINVSSFTAVERQPGCVNVLQLCGLLRYPHSCAVLPVQSTCGWYNMLKLGQNAAAIRS